MDDIFSNSDFTTLCHHFLRLYSEEVVNFCGSLQFMLVPVFTGAEEAIDNFLGYHRVASIEQILLRVFVGLTIVTVRIIVLIPAQLLSFLARKNRHYQRLGWLCHIRTNPLKLAFDREFKLIEELCGPFDKVVGEEAVMSQALLLLLDLLCKQVLAVYRWNAEFIRN